jgi:hypothetical protein
MKNPPFTTKILLLVARRLLFIALALILMSGCNRAGAPQAGAHRAAAAEPEAVAVPASPAAAGRALVVTMNLGLRVADVDVARDAIQAATARAGGYVANATSSGADDERAVTLELRIPRDRATSAHRELAALGEVTSDVQKTEDVTEEKADLEARLDNARVEEKRIVEIMSQRAGSIGDVLQAEKELARVRETIERYEAQKRTLDGRVDLATIHVSIAARPTPAWQTPGESIARAASEGLRGARALAVYGAMALAASAPIVLPPLALAAAILGLLRMRRRSRLAATAG